MAAKRPLDDEDEYHFPTHEFIDETKDEEAKEAETEGEYKPVAHKSYPSAQEIIKNLKGQLIKYKRFVAVCGIIVVALIAFELMRPHHTTRIISEVPPQQQQQPPVGMQSTGTTTLPAASLNTLREQTAGTAELSRLQQTTTDQQTQLSRLSDQVNTLTDNLQQMKTMQDKLNSNVLMLSHQIRELNTEMLAGMQAPSKKGLQGFRPILPVYHLRAVIPGRAWLEDDQGGTLTVSVGDRLIGYGIVIKIDAQQGLVYTDSGKNIKYSQ